MEPEAPLFEDDPERRRHRLELVAFVLVHAVILVVWLDVCLTVFRLT